VSIVKEIYHIDAAFFPSIEYEKFLLLDLTNSIRTTPNSILYFNITNISLDSCDYGKSGWLQYTYNFDRATSELLVQYCKYANLDLPRIGVSFDLYSTIELIELSTVLAEIDELYDCFFFLEEFESHWEDENFINVYYNTINSGLEASVEEFESSWEWRDESLSTVDYYSTIRNSILENDGTSD
jgi:hypothetical protein